MKAKLSGLSEVMSNLNAQVNAIEGRTMTGLYSAGLFVQKESNRRAPKDTGNLRESSFVRNVFNGVVVGYTANYAAAVHEAPGTLKGEERKSGSKKGTYWEVGEPKFLENAVRENTQEIIDRIVRRAKV